jgi:hypothetical protein
MGNEARLKVKVQKMGNEAISHVFFVIFIDENSILIDENTIILTDPPKRGMVWGLWCTCVCVRDIIKRHN